MILITSVVTASHAPYLGWQRGVILNFNIDAHYIVFSFFQYVNERLQLALCNVRLSCSYTRLNLFSSCSLWKASILFRGHSEHHRLWVFSKNSCSWRSVRVCSLVSITSFKQRLYKGIWTPLEANPWALTQACSATISMEKSTLAHNNQYFKLWKPSIYTHKKTLLFLFFLSFLFVFCFCFVFRLWHTQYHINMLWITHEVSGTMIKQYLKGM